ncbi:hypothetical protein LCGC14_1108360, partial [marine sediment metagenome]
NAFNVINNDTISIKDSATLFLSNSIVSHINYAKFWVQKQGESNWILLNNATYAPFSAPFINLPWTSTTVFHLLVDLQMTYSLFGIVYNNFTKANITLDLDGPTINIDTNPNDLLYQIQQAGGTWVTPIDFNGFINGSISSSDTDFDSYKISYDYGKGWREDSHLYSANDTLNWQIKYIPDGDISFKITGYDSRDNPSNILEFSFVNDQNFFSDIYIENYAFDQIYNIFEPFKFKIIPLAQDLEVLNLTVGITLYSFSKVDPPSESLYFEKEIEFDILDFDFENQTVDTQILTIKASDLRSQSIELKIPITMSLGLDTQIIVNDLKIVKNFYELEGRNESTWWKFDEGGGIIVYDSSEGGKDGTLVGVEQWVNGKVGNYALGLEGVYFIPSNIAMTSGIYDSIGDLYSINNDFSQFSSLEGYNYDHDNRDSYEQELWAEDFASSEPYMTQSYEPDDYSSSYTMNPLNMQNYFPNEFAQGEWNNWNLNFDLTYTTSSFATGTFTSHLNSGSSSSIPSGYQYNQGSLVSSGDLYNADGLDFSTFTSADPYYYNGQQQLWTEDFTSFQSYMSQSYEPDDYSSSYTMNPLDMQNEFPNEYTQEDWSNWNLNYNSQYTSSSFSNGDLDSTLISQSDTYVPVQAQTPSGDFDVLEGTSDFAGDLSLANGVSYTTFDSSIPDLTNHYPATYSFENLADYTSGTDIDFVDFNGYPSAQIIPGIDGHNKVLELTSNTAWNNIWNDFSDKVIGTIEWWVRTPQSYVSSRLILYGDNGATLASYVYFHDDGWIWATNGSSNVQVATYTPNTWIHMRVDFWTTMVKLFTIRINGGAQSGPYFFKNLVSSIDRAYFDSGGGSNIRYLDAIAYSWTPGYTIGDNLDTTTGHFPGTYSFENDAHGASGTAISMIDEYTGNPGIYLDVVINDVQTDHKKVLRVVDSRNTGYTTGTHNFDNPQTYGTIEFWLKMSGSYGATGSTDRFSELYFRSSSNQVAFGIQLKMLEGGYVSGDRADLSYWDGNEWIEYADGEDEVWYRNRIDFDCEDDKYSIFTYNPDGTLLGSATGIDFENDLVTLDEIYFTSIVSHYRGIACYDAFGFTWEGYNIGDNRFDDAPGFITFEIDAQLDSANRDITSVSLDYSYQNVDSKQVSLQIYNYAQQNWGTEIDSFIYSSFTPQTYVIGSDYYDQNYNLKFRFEGLPSSSSYEFYLDQFKISYNYFPTGGNIYTSPTLQWETMNGDYSITQSFISGYVPAGPTNVVPNLDINNEWGFSYTPYHYDDIDEYPSKSMTDMVATFAGDDIGAVEEFQMSQFILPTGAIVSKVEVWVYGEGEYYYYPGIKISWDNGNSWGTRKDTPDHISPPDFGYDFTGLSKSQNELNQLSVSVRADYIFNPGPPPDGQAGYFHLGALWVKVYYDTPGYEVNTVVNMEVTDPDCVSVDYLKYSHRTNISQVIDLDIWNWGTSQWNDIENVNNYATFDADSYNLGQSSPYVNSSNGVRVRFMGLGSSPFQLWVDQLALDYSYTISTGITKTINDAFLNRYDSGFSNYQKLYDVIVSFGYTFTKDLTQYNDFAQFTLDGTNYALNKDGAFHTFSQTFEFDSSSRSNFDIMFNISNGDLSLSNMGYDFTFKCLDTLDNIVLQQTFGVDFPNEGTLTQFQKDNGEFFIDTDIDFNTVSDGKTYTNKYGSTYKLQIIFNIKTDGAWRNNAYIYNASSSFATRIAFNIAQWMTNNNYDSFENFTVEYVMIGNSTDLIVNDLRLFTYQTEGASPMDIEATINIASLTSEDTVDPLIKLYYSYKTDNNQQVKIQIFNGIGWDDVDTRIFSEFTPQFIWLSSSYIDSNFDVKFRFIGTETSSPYTGFNFYLDQFKLDASWTRTQGPINADISKTITDAFLNNFLTNYNSFDNYQNLSDVTVSFDYTFTNNNSLYLDFALFEITYGTTTISDSLTRDGSQHTYSRTFEFDSTSLDDFSVKFNISNGDLILNNLDYNVTFKCLATNDQILLQQMFELNFPNESSLSQEDKDNGMFIIDTTYSLLTVSDILDDFYYNTYGRQGKFEIVYGIKADGKWCSSIFSTNSSEALTRRFKVYEFMETNNLDTFEDFNTTFVIIGNNTDLTVSQVKFLDYRAYIPPTINFTTTFIVNSNNFQNPRLNYSFRTNITQTIQVNVWNYDLSRWDLITSAYYPTFLESSYVLNNSH